MSMYKRPSKRVKCNLPLVIEPPKEGSFLYDIITKTDPSVYEFKKRPVYQQDRYFTALKKNNEEMGIPYIEPQLLEPTSLHVPEKTTEPELVYGDRVQVTLRVLKSGIVRVKVNGAIADMYDKYYRHGKKPPFKTVLQAYKSHGFSKEFLERMKKNNEKQLTFAKKVPGILEKIFDKEPVKKPKKEKKSIIEEEAPPLEEEEDEDDIPEDEGELDVEPTEEEEVVEEEEYFSEPDA